MIAAKNNNVPATNVDTSPNLLSTSSKPDKDIMTSRQDNEDGASSPTTDVVENSNGASSIADGQKERMARFQALRARAKSSSTTNLQAARAEAARLATPMSDLAPLARKRTAAAAKLERAEIEDAGEDYERFRAWDWTIDEAEKWDRHVRRKEAHRDDAAFSDYRSAANKTYNKQVRDGVVRAGGGEEAVRERYEREKTKAIEAAAVSGGLDIVETEHGELIAIDRDGTFYSTADSIGTAGGKGGSKPDRAAVDRLVADLKRAEETRMKRRAKYNSGDDADTTYINEKNKQFNLKLARFYNKYTTEVRDSFERGTMI